MGKLYAPPELIDLYKTKIVPKAFCVSPNYFEAELLTGIKIIDEESALNAI
jgi:pyridoxine kinase